MVLTAKRLASWLYIDMSHCCPLYNSALTTRACNNIRLSTVESGCIQKQRRDDDVIKQLMVEQSLNKKHPDFKRTAQTSVQIYKVGGGQSFRHHETSIINRFV